MTSPQKPIAVEEVPKLQSTMLGAVADLCERAAGWERRAAASDSFSERDGLKLEASLLRERAAALGKFANFELPALISAREERDALFNLRPLDELHEDFGAVLFWNIPVDGPPIVGSSIDDDFEDNCAFYTHWSPLPNIGGSTPESQP